MELPETTTFICGEGGKTNVQFKEDRIGMDEVLRLVARRPGRQAILSSVHPRVTGLVPGLRKVPQIAPLD